MTILYGQRQENITLVAAISACQQCLSAAVGLFYSPESCFLSQLEGVTAKDSNGQIVNLDRVFEARIFNADYELRWLNNTGGLGTAVLLSEKSITNHLEKSVAELEAIDTQVQTYLLWGEGYSANLQPGWSRLATSRLGKLDVPISGVNKSKQRIKLTAKEYFQILDHLYGNVIVAEERLMVLQKV